MVALDEGLQWHWALPDVRPVKLGFGLKEMERSDYTV